MEAYYYTLTHDQLQWCVDHAEQLTWEYRGKPRKGWILIPIELIVEYLKLK